MVNFQCESVVSFHYKSIDLLDLRSQEDAMHAEASFVYGFKLGAMIVTEVMRGKGELVRNGA